MTLNYKLRISQKFIHCVTVTQVVYLLYSLWETFQFKFLFASVWMDWKNFFRPRGKFLKCYSDIVFKNKRFECSSGVTFCGFFNLPSCNFGLYQTNFDKNIIVENLNSCINTIIYYCSMIRHFTIDGYILYKNYYKCIPLFQNK